MPITFQSSHDAFAVYLTPGFLTAFRSTPANHGSSLCTDENDWTTVAAAQFQQWTCNGGTNQQYTSPRSPPEAAPNPPPMTPDDRLDISGASTASGAAVDQWPCNYNTNEQFTLTAVSTGVYEVKAVNSGLCVAPALASHRQRRAAVQVACSTAAANTWGITT